MTKLVENTLLCHNAYRAAICYVLKYCFISILKVDTRVNNQENS